MDYNCTFTISSEFKLDPYEKIFLKPTLNFFSSHKSWLQKLYIITYFNV